MGIARRGCIVQQGGHRCVVQRGETKMQIKIAGLVPESIVDGPGIRFTVFTQGCPHHCPGCHNPQTHDFAGGEWKDTDEIIAQFQQNPLLKGITLSGGDPFVQPAACAELARAAHKAGKDVITYTGYTFEQLLSGKYLMRGCCWRRRTF